MATLEMPTAEREETARRIREGLAMFGALHCAYEPGDATHYEFTLVRMSGVAFVPSPKRARSNLHDGAGDTVRYLLVDTDHSRAMTVDLTDGHYTDPTYIREKFTDNNWTAYVLAELLCMISGAPELAGLRADAPYIFGGE